jgi:hypothetical protein
MACLFHPDHKARAVVRDHRECRGTLVQGAEMVRTVRTGEMALTVQPDHRDLKETPVHKALEVQQVHRGLKGTLVHKARKANPAYPGATTRLPLKL